MPWAFPVGSFSRSLVVWGRSCASCLGPEAARPSGEAGPQPGGVRVIGSDNAALAALARRLLPRVGAGDGLGVCLHRRISARLALLAAGAHMCNEGTLQLRQSQRAEKRDHDSRWNKDAEE